MSVAPPLGKELASNDKKTRDAAVRDLRRFLATTADKPMDELEMAKLWKGIFYCFWMSDKPLVQQELSTALSDLLLVPKSADASLDFLRGFWVAIVREWSGLDYLRMDKYYMLVRRFVNASFRLLIRESWEGAACAAYNDIIAGPGGPLFPEDPRIPASLSYHLADIYMEELNKAISANPSAPPAPLDTLLVPFMTLNALSPSPTTHNRLHSSLFTPLFAALLEHSSEAQTKRNYRSTVSTPALSPEESDEPRRKRARIEPPEPPLPAVVKNARVARKGPEETKEDGNDESEDEKARMPATELRHGLLKVFLEIAGGDDTKEASRKRMYRVWKEASEASEQGKGGNGDDQTADTRGQ